MKAAVIQTNATGDRERNVAKAVAHVREAIRRKAGFILLPEAFGYRGRPDPRKGYSLIAENIPGPSTKPFCELAKKHRVMILTGTVCERIPGSRKVFNTCVFIDRNGSIAAKYRKIHLFDAVIGRKTCRESRRIRAGRRTAVVNIGPWKAGLSICYDLRFPEMYRRYVQRGVGLLCVPSAFTKTTGTAHWKTLLRARAIENLCYVLAPNQIGADSQGIESYGHSMIIDPWGTVLAEASGHREQIIYADLDRRKMEKHRSVLPGQGARLSTNRK